MDSTIIKTLVKRTFVVLAVSVLGACVAAPQLPVALNNQVLESEQNRVGVIMSRLPDLDVQLPGAACLLCLALAESMNASLSSHVNSLNAQEFTVVKSDLVKRLKAKGVNVVPIEEPFDASDFPKYSSDLPNTAKQDFSALKNEYNISHLLVVDVTFLGMWRSYANYVPTSDPVAYLKASIYLVNLENNSYEWFLPLELKQSAQGDWDEPPNFPGLTNAYYQVLAEGREEIVSEF